MIRLNNVHIPLDYNNEILKNKVAKELKINKAAIKNVSLFRRSIDARKKDNIYFLCSVDVETDTNEDKLIKKCKNAAKAEKFTYKVKKWKKNVSPVVVGMGPAGLFAALILAQSGAKPIVIERGRDVDAEAQTLTLFGKAEF